MKVTKTANISRLKNKIREVANEGCNICPECGESKEFIEYLREGILDKGVSGGLEKTWVEGFLE